MQSCLYSWPDYSQGDGKRIWPEQIRSYPCFRLINGLPCSTVQNLHKAHTFCHVLPWPHLQQYCPAFFLSLACWSFLGFPNPFPSLIILCTPSPDLHWNVTLSQKLFLTSWDRIFTLLECLASPSQHQSHLKQPYVYFFFSFRLPASYASFAWFLPNRLSHLQNEARFLWYLNYNTTNPSPMKLAGSQVTPEIPSPPPQKS